MGLKNIFKSIFGFELEDDAKRKEIQQAWNELHQAQAKYDVRQLAWEICVQRIAKAMCKCEYRVFKKGKEVKDDIYYKLNVSPNPNQSATQFWEKVIHTLYTQMECLIVVENGHFFCADTFIVDDTMTLTDHVFKDVQVGKLTFKKTFLASDVIFLKLNDERIKAWLDSTLTLQSELLEIAMKSYRFANSNKYLAHIDRIREDSDDLMPEIMSKELKAFLESNSSAVMSEYDGLEFKKLENGATVKDTRDLKNLIDDVIEITCKALLIPTNIMTGQVTDTSRAMDDFLTFRLDSTAALIQDELNRKLFRKKDYLRGDSIKVSTTAIKHVDLLDMSSAVEKLISCGYDCINDVRRLVGEPVIDEEWANNHYMTKNFALITEINEQMKGGGIP